MCGGANCSPSDSKSFDHISTNAPYAALTLAFDAFRSACVISADRRTGVAALSVAAEARTITRLAARPNHPIRGFIAFTSTGYVHRLTEAGPRTTRGQSSSPYLAG